MEFSREEFWSGLPFPNSGDLPEPGIKSGSPVASTLQGEFFTTVPPGKPRKPRDAQKNKEVDLGIQKEVW